MKYFLVKGCNGFGNMMSVLSLAHEIVKVNQNLTLVIDWTHPEWKLGFDNYFSINSIKYLNYEEFKKLVSNSNFKFFPDFFNKDNITKPLVEIYPSLDKDNKYEETFNPVINIFTDQQFGFNYLNNNDIFVFSYNWVGYNYIKSLWNNLRLNKELEEDIRNKINSLGTYNAIHVRHTDNKNISTLWVTNYLKDNLHKKIYVATDNEIVLNICKSSHPNIFNYTKFYEKSKPLHIQELKDEDKHITNNNTIIDMYILINSYELKITPIKTVPYMSTYSLMAVSLKY